MSMRAAVEAEEVRLRAAVADHDYCFNDSDDRRCLVSGWLDCRPAVGEMRAMLTACDDLRGHLDTAEMAIASDHGRAELAQKP